jgi:hypothetical protein
MSRRLAFTLLSALLALQAVTTSAFAAAAHDCPGHATDAGSDPGCACCPDDTSAVACEAACGGAAAPVTSALEPAAPARAHPVTGEIPPFTGRTDAPLHPPPIG